MYKGTFSRFARYGLGESFTRSNFRLFSSTPAKYKKAFSPVEDFFAKHPSFAHDATAQISKEFKALCSHYGWTKKHFKKENTTEQSKRAQLVKHDYQEALISEFGEIYGKDPESLWGWKELCEAVRIKPIPDTVTECRKVCSNINFLLWRAYMSSSQLKLRSFLGSSPRACESRRPPGLQTDGQ